MCTARPSWRSMTIADMVYKKYMFNVNVHLDGIISIDAKNRVSNRIPSNLDNNIVHGVTRNNIKLNLPKVPIY